MRGENKKLKFHAIGMIGILILQYLLGISTSLFISFPQHEPDRKMWEFAWRQLPLALHIIVGFLLLLGTGVLLIRAIKNKSRAWILSSLISLIAILGAIIFGALFIPTQTAVYSFIMAVGFIIALLSFFWGLYTDK